MECLQYLDNCTFETRPKAIILECVGNLARTRTAAGLGEEKGTQKVSDALELRGYVGDWRVVCSRSFFLPQSRSRAWGVFFKVGTSSLGPAGHVGVATSGGA